MKNYLTWSLCFMFVGIVWLLLGFHNIDMAYNISPECFDIGLSGNEMWYKDDIYLKGMFMFNGSLIFFLIGYLILFSNTQKDINL